MNGGRLLTTNTFLLSHLAKPFLPVKVHGERVGGFNFEGRPYRFADGKQRFMDGSNQVYGCELGRLARELMAATYVAATRAKQSLAIVIDKLGKSTLPIWEP